MFWTLWPASLNKTRHREMQPCSCAGTWLDLEMDDVETMLPLYPMNVAGTGPYHRFFLAPAPPGQQAGAHGGSDADPCLLQVRGSPLLAHRPPLLSVPAAPYRMGIAAHRVHAWTPGHQLALTALLPCISPGAAVLDVAGSEFILGPEEATLAQLGVTPAWRLEVQQGPLDCSLALSVVLPSGKIESTAAALVVQLSSLATGALAAAQQQQQQEKGGAATAEASLSAVQQLMAAVAPGMQACSQLLAVAAAEAAAGPPPRPVAEAGCQVGSGGSSSAGVQTEAPPAAQVQTLGGSSAALLLEASRGTQTDAGLGPGVGDAWTQTDRPDMVRQCGLCGRSPHNTPGVKLHQCICQAIYYCGQPCQERDWAVHKRYCTILRRYLQPW
ncbi:hypothetical protein CHLNCDRAFT_136176 [Chlorella variabilis]|uniref:MYND-type domain-containing protein n=1 Tax=Chlorella variabilis TaxID=554065 RepID=E1ZJX7_CHLVA|nr:hypothetical protein CHLNCDRAFT_136176 [Chlorella variabilis]EFN53938.1 hypothetical protein CHLNCDRAFT_136176 [Chlorella variabilis]|eukprot:XP_005846040.1 hypothetical protein CHLNCDRAFT_136176 [Chlorella variabilis]